MVLLQKPILKHQKCPVKLLKPWTGFERELGQKGEYMIDT